MPQLWLLAGGNGAGKTTFHELALAHRGVKLINADRIARIIAPEHPENVSYQAAAIVENVLHSLLQQQTSFCFETVFSHSSKIDFIARARSSGYEVIVIYIHLQVPQLNEARVRQRILQGGHAVPADKIRSRIPKTMHNVAKALPLASEARLLDNSLRDDPFRQLAVIRQGSCIWSADPLPVWAVRMMTAVEPPILAEAGQSPADKSGKPCK